MSKQQQLELIATLRQGQLDLGADVATLRVAFNDVMARIPVASDVDHVPTTIGGVNAVDVTIRGIDTANTILYFHGGVYVIGSAATSVPLVSDLARRAHAKAVTVDYRLAPEHPYPAAVDDARAAYEGLLAQGIDAGQIALAGESSGGGLAVATLLALRDAGTPLPSSAFLMSPYADLTLSGETILENQATDLVLTTEGLRLRVPDYVGRADPSNPQISPVLAISAGYHRS
jgi:acetyl esterase/lipase